MNGELTEYCNEHAMNYSIHAINKVPWCVFERITNANKIEAAMHFCNYERASSDNYCSDLLGSRRVNLLCLFLFPLVWSRHPPEPFLVSYGEYR